MFKSESLQLGRREAAGLKFGIVKLKVEIRCVCTVDFPDFW